MNEITAEYYTQATGYAPENDDLERSNCAKAGAPGHNNCGWNWSWNLPRFMVGDSLKKGWNLPRFMVGDSLKKGC